MLVKIKESFLPMILFVLTLSAFIVFYYLFFRDYLGDRVYPVNGSEGDWLSALDKFFYAGLLLSFLISLVWFIISWVTNPEPVSIKRKWIVLFVVAGFAGVGLAVAFLLFNSTTSRLFNAYVFSYILFMPLLSYLASSLKSHSECPGWLDYVGQ